MNRLPQILVVSAALGLGLLAPVPAFALGGCNCTIIASYHNATRNHVTTEVSNAVSDINGHTTDTGNLIIENLWDAVGRNAKQVSSTLDRQVRAQQNFTDAQLQNDAIKAREEAHVDVRTGRFDPAVGACAAFGAGAALSAGRGASPSPNGHDFTNWARNWSRGIGERGEEVRQGPLGIASGVIEDRDRFANYDGFLDPTTDVRFLTSTSTLDTDDEEVALIMARLQQNIIDPSPSQPLTAAQANTPEGMVELARRQADDAQRSVAHNLFGWRASFQSNHSTNLRDWINDNAPAGFPTSDNPKASLNEFFETAVAKYSHQDRVADLAGMDTNALLREMITMNAFSMQLDWYRFQLDLERAMADASIVAASVDAGERSLSY